LAIGASSRDIPTVVATFGLLHGAWHDSSCWEPLTKCLKALGHSTITPELPLHDPKVGYEQRARGATEALAKADVAAAPIITHQGRSKSHPPEA
jgi:hypothetical protein